MRLWQLREDVGNDLKREIGSCIALSHGNDLDELNIDQITDHLAKQEKISDSETVKQLLADMGHAVDDEGNVNLGSDDMDPMGGMPPTDMDGPPAGGPEEPFDDALGGGGPDMGPPGMGSDPMMGGGPESVDVDFENDNQVDRSFNADGGKIMKDLVSSQVHKTF